VSYNTPKTIVHTPRSEHSENDSSSDNVIQISDDSDDAEFEDMYDAEDSPANDKTALTWQGHSRSDLQALWNIARSHRDAGEIKEAEGKLRKVLVGMGHISGKINDETVKAAYDLADLYATTDRTGEARIVLEKLVQAHVYALGCEDGRTQNIALQAVDLLHMRSRSDDSLALLSRANEALDICTSRSKPKPRRRARDKGKGICRSTIQKPASCLSEVTESVLLRDVTPASIDNELTAVQERVAAEEHAAIDSLIAIISQCDSRPDLSMQQIKAYAELLNLYYKLDKVEENDTAFQGAFAALSSAWEAYDWYRDVIESLGFMEAILHLGAITLKCGYTHDTRHMILVASQKSTDVFGSDESAQYGCISPLASSTKPT
jgi:tetratricopeptide (TPR) repeat protein